MRIHVHMQAQSYLVDDAARLALGLDRQLCD